MKKIISQVSAAIKSYNMILPNDKIAIGVSGGKDSLALLITLANIKKFHKNPFEIVAICIDPCFGGVETDFSKVEELCNKLNVELVIKRSQLGKIIFEERKEKNPCSLCARMRRGMLHDIAKELNCNKVALGHHLNDAVDTFFMNLFNCGSISCFSPVSYLSRKDLYLIRPLIFCEEKDIISFINRNSISVVKSNCPADGNTERKHIDDILKELKKNYPDINSKVIGAMQRNNISDWSKKV